MRYHLVEAYSAVRSASSKNSDFDECGGLKSSVRKNIVLKKNVTAVVTLFAAPNSIN